MIKSAAFIQFFLYSIVGVLACSTDIGFFIFFSDVCGFHPLLSTSASFTLATLVNYLLCYNFVFASDEGRRFYQILRLFFVAFVGLFCNTLCFWLFLSLVTLPAIYVKILVIPIVMIWNFLSRRYFVFSTRIHPSTVMILERLSRGKIQL